MAESQELFDCSICLELLKDPVTTACGHSYCMKCINSFWDTSQRRGYSCPLCGVTFNERPALKRNTLIAALMEKHSENNSKSAAEAAEAAEAGDTDTGDGDVQCDACTGRKRKATKFCLVCLTSYCETHLEPHFEVLPLKKHKLIQPSVKIQDQICGLHDKLLEIYCRTDQQVICLQCVMDGHKGHDTVAVEGEKCEFERKLDWTEQKIKDQLLHLEEEKAILTEVADSISVAAWEACDDFQRLSGDHIRYVERKCSELVEEVGKAEKAGLDQISCRLIKLQHEKRELNQKVGKVHQVSLLKDQPVHFLQSVQALGDLSAFTEPPQIDDLPPGFGNAQKKEINNVLKCAKNDIINHFEKSEAVIAHPSLPDNFLRKYLLAKCRKHKVKVDPNTVAACLCLSDTKDELSWGAKDQAHPDHPDRFTYFPQALCERGLRKSYYWEVEWDSGDVDLAVSYKGIKRKGSGKDCRFGHNSLSWKLTCSPSGCTFWHNNLQKSQIPPVRSRRVGIHLDYKAGTLSFYSVSELGDLSLLHRVQTYFTEPVYPGFSVDLGSTLKICNF